MSEELKDRTQHTNTEDLTLKDLGEGLWQIFSGVFLSSPEGIGSLALLVFWGGLAAKSLLASN